MKEEEGRGANARAEPDSAATVAGGGGVEGGPPSGKARLSNSQPSPAHIPFRSVLRCMQREFKPSFHVII